MPLDNSIEHLHPKLKLLYTEAKARYIQRNPATKENPAPPRPRLNETSRSAAIQNAYYAQGRIKDVATVNKLRKDAGLWNISADENKYRVTNAKYGQSAHNFALSRAWDIAFVNAKGQYIDKPALYKDFWLVVAEVAAEMGIAVTWGGTWGDNPHTELKGWRTLK